MITYDISLMILIALYYSHDSPNNPHDKVIITATGLKLLGHGGVVIQVDEKIMELKDCMV